MSTREPAEVQGGFRASVSLLRRNRDFRRLYTASMISLGGDWFLLVALFGLLLKLSDSPLAIAFAVAAQEIPFFLMSPLGGTLADRLDRRRVMVTCDVARAALCLGFLLIHDPSLVWLAYVLLAAISSFSAAFDPASSAALPNLVVPEDLSVANALSGSLWGTMLAVGAALGGLVAGTLGTDAAILVDAGSFVVSGLLIMGIRGAMSEDRTDEHPTVREATRETVTYARRDHRVLALLAVKAGFGIGAGVLVLISVFAVTEFHRGDIGIGLLMAARGVGALIGPFVGRSLLGPGDRRLFAIIGAALATFGAGYVLLGLAPTLLLALPTLVLAHMGGGAQWTLSSYGLQRIVPDRIRGRIFAFDGAMVTLTLTISGLVTAWLADQVGPRITAIGLGLVAMAWAATWAWLTADVRRATMLEGCGPAPAEADAA